jgi:hypothetical protein
VRSSPSRRLGRLGDLGAGTQQGGAATGDDALLDGGAGGRQRVFDAVLLLLELHLGGGADLDDGHAADQLGQTLLELLAVPVGVGVSISRLIWVMRPSTSSEVAGAVDDGGVVLGDDDLAGAAEQLEVVVFSSLRPTSSAMT